MVTRNKSVGGTRRKGMAGRFGPGIRSDLRVTVELRDEPGIEIELSSRVEPYYGDAIRAQADAVLVALGITGATVRIEDSGALPFVIAARIEAAVLATGFVPTGDARPNVTARGGVPSARDRLRRSRLYVPGNEPKYFVTAALYQPDGVILDLEDSVHPDAKAAARILVRNALRTVAFGGAERMVRINQLPLGLADLEAIVPERPDLILLPKVERPEQVVEVGTVIDQLTDGVGGEAPWLMPILESALGIENAFAIASAHGRVAALTIGLEDYAADLGVPKSADGAESVYARSRMVNAAKAAGVQAIDSVYGQVDDLDGLSDWAAQSKNAGFEGMGCLHPRQIEPIHLAFNPTAVQIVRARRILGAFEKAMDQGVGVVSLGSKMIDPPVVEQSLRLIRLAEKLGLIPNDEDAPS